MGTKERLEILRDKIKCPQFGDNEYGEWGALKLEQREAIKDLIDSNKNKDKTIRDLLKRISNLEFEVEERDRRIDKAIEYIEKHTITYNKNLINEIQEFEYISTSPKELLSILKGSDKE